jgi:hypothetical protein
VGFAISAIVLPLALFLLFERQARRLDALAAHGETVDAQVTGVSPDGGATFYAYRVAGNEYTWNVARAELPFSVGQVFSASYLPEEPSFSRPFADKSLAAREAARNRSFSHQACFGVGFFLLVFAGLVHRDLQRRRAGAPSEINDPQAYQRRLRFTALAFLPVFLLIGGFHLQNAMQKSESVLPGLIGLVLAASILGAMFYFGGRAGPHQARERSARILRWAVPIAGGVALLRLVVFLLKR